MHLALLLLSTVSVSSLLPEMIDLDHLTRRPSPFYKMAQASSYDRRSNPGPSSDPFANGDAGNFLRVEQTSNGNEYVMADLKGPGAVVRVWSANPAGIIRFYFDGEKTPRLQAKMADLLQGRVEPFVNPFAYNAANGTNLYFPFPYAKSLKITGDESDGNRIKSLYYHVGYRTYPSGMAVQTYSPGDLEANRTLMSKVRIGLNYPRSLTDSPAPTTNFTLPPNGRRQIVYQGSGTVRELQIRIPFPLVQTIREMDWEDAHQPHNVLRSIILTVYIGGNRVIQTPLGDFFGTSPGLNAYRTLPFEVRADGTMICRLPMPYRNEIAFVLENWGKVEVPLSFKPIVDKGPSMGAYALHAQWSVDKGSTRPFRDMNFLTAKGEGIWVGSNMHISNPSPGWWGEGDEKVYVDGESFPSTFGTGTEDYYGYAWSAPIVFQKPYHAQPRSDGPANFGHSIVQRWHVLDPIPYTRSLKFDLEMWHWAEVDANFTHTAFWYAPAGSAQVKEVDRGLLLPMNLTPPKPVKGALEGESLEILQVTGGKTEQQGGFWELSAGKQLWWIDVSPGNKLVFSVPVPEAGRYEVFGNFCHARDYGIHKMRLNGVEIAPRDFYGTGVSWKKLSLGTFDLPAGKVRLEVECVGNNPAAIPSRMFGLDYLLLEKR